MLTPESFDRRAKPVGRNAKSFDRARDINPDFWPTADPQPHFVSQLSTCTPFSVECLIGACHLPQHRTHKYSIFIFAMDTNHTLMQQSRTAARHETKRRVRKGTRSCWECKRRKMKCTLDPVSTSAVCNGCRRRGSNCVSQEFLEDASPSTTASIAVDESTSPMSDGDGRRADDFPTPVSMSSNPPSSSVHVQQRCPQPSKLYKLRFATTPASPGGHESLSQYLHSSLPSQADMRKICYAHRHPSVPVLAHEILTLPYTTLHHNGFSTPESLLEAPAPSSHPVLLAKHMLQLAIFL